MPLSKIATASAGPSLSSRNLLVGPSAAIVRLGEVAVNGARGGGLQGVVQRAYSAGLVASAMASSTSFSRSEGAMS